MYCINIVKHKLQSTSVTIGCDKYRFYSDTQMKITNSHCDTQISGRYVG